MRGIVSLVDHDEASLMRKVKSAPQMVGWDLASKVSIEKSYSGSKEPLTFVEFSRSCGNAAERSSCCRLRLRHQDQHSPRPRPLWRARHGCAVEDSRRRSPESQSPMASSSPTARATPRPWTTRSATSGNLLGKKPIFGICLGHQIMGLAFGGRTFKLKFGHHGGNQPVLNTDLNKVEITAQNHGFAVDPRQPAGGDSQLPTSTLTTRLSKAWSTNPCRPIACNTTRKLRRVRTTPITSLRSFSR